MSSDPTKCRELVLIPKEIIDRIFQSTPEGDRAKQHISLIVFSMSNGKYLDNILKINGATAPIIVHTKQEKKGKENSSSAVDKRIDLYNEPSRAHVDEKFLDGLESYKYLDIKC